MDIYEINKNTLAIIPIGYNKSKVIEKDNEFVVNMEPLSIIKYSCEYFGSTYEGRHAGTKSIMNITHKSPIIIEESHNLICFPTTSPRLTGCSWIILNNIKSFNGNHESTDIIFDNNYVLNICISINSFENQVHRSYMLESLLRKRIENY